jgi:hypothetical protein
MARRNDEREEPYPGFLRMLRRMCPKAGSEMTVTIRSPQSGVSVTLTEKTGQRLDEAIRRQEMKAKRKREKGKEERGKTQ